MFILSGTPQAWCGLCGSAERKSRVVQSAKQMVAPAEVRASSQGPPAVLVVRCELRDHLLRIL